MKTIDGWIRRLEDRLAPHASGDQPSVADVVRERRRRRLEREGLPYEPIAHSISPQNHSRKTIAQILRAGRATAQQNRRVESQ
jgi:hypothetical protein